MTPQDDLDRLLQALNHIEAPVEMQQRLLEKLSAHASRPTRKRLPAFRGNFAWPAALATTCAVLAAAAFLFHQAPNNRAPHLRDGNIVTKVGPTTLTQPHPESRAGSTGVLGSQFSVLILPHPNSRASHLRDGNIVSKVGPTDQPQPIQALTSFPAPPMPLTDQEKLLLRIAHRGDPAQYAALNPSARDLQNLEDVAQYEQFFAEPLPPTPGTIGDDQWQPALK